MAGTTRGPDPLITEELTAQVCEILKKGNYRKVAAALVGVTEVTFSRWMNTAGQPYEDFQAAVRKAEAEVESESVELILASMDPADRKWYLARKAPNRWAETKRIDVQGRLEVGTKLDASVFSDPEGRAALLGLSRFLLSRDPESGDTDSSSPGEDSQS